MKTLICINLYITFVRKGINPSPSHIIKVTEKVQSSFAHYWEIWGHKHVFAGDPNSFCGTLNRVLGGYKARPKAGGPFKLIVCYKHRGHGSYKEYSYDEKEELEFPIATPEETFEHVRSLLSANRSNLSFVGERLHITPEDFSFR